MITDRYEPIDMRIWQGRIDSTENYDAFRWHQHIQQLDLTLEHPPLKNEFGKSVYIEYYESIIF